jgi:hypothetical protein
METVEGNHRLGEAGTGNLVHAVGEIKRHFLNQQADGFRYLLQDASIEPFYNQLNIKYIAIPVYIY